MEQSAGRKHFGKNFYGLVAERRKQQEAASPTEKSQAKQRKLASRRATLDPKEKGSSSLTYGKALPTESRPKKDSRKLLRIRKGCSRLSSGAGSRAEETPEKKRSFRRTRGEVSETSRGAPVRKGVPLVMGGGGWGVGKGIDT